MDHKVRERALALSKELPDSDGTFLQAMAEEMDARIDRILLAKEIGDADKLREFRRELLFKYLHYVALAHVVHEPKTQRVRIACTNKVG